MRKVLVTGGAGFIGTNLIKNLLDRDIEVISLDDYSTGSETNELKKASYLKMDIEQIESINIVSLTHAFILQLNLEFNHHFKTQKNQLE